MTTMDRIAAHKAAHVIYAWHCVDYLPCAVTVVATVDRTGRGRFETIIVTEATFEQTMRALADQCDALPGAMRGKGRAAA